MLLMIVRLIGIPTSVSPSRSPTWSCERACEPCCAGARCAGSKSTRQTESFEVGLLRIDAAIQDQRVRPPDRSILCEQDRGLERVVLAVLLAHLDTEPPLSQQDVVGETSREGEMEITDALDSLGAAGLIDRSGGLVWPSRTRVSALVQQEWELAGSTTS